MTTINYYEEWLNGKTNATRPKYKTAWKTVIEYYESIKKPTTQNELLARVIADRKKPIEKQGSVEKELTAWLRWVIKDYPTKKRKEDSEGNKLTGKIGLGHSTAASYITPVKGFFSTYGYPLNNHFTKPKNVKLKNGKPDNAKIEYRPEQIKKLLDVCKSLRDKSVILLMFQSGMDIKTTCNLNYGDVEGIEETHAPIMITTTRQKTGVTYRTFISHDAINAIKIYLNERRTRGEEIKFKTPLFVSEGTHINKAARMETWNFQNNMRGLVFKAGLVSKDKLEQADISPARPHALRTGFSTILKLKGINQDIVDGFLGHEDEYGGAYTSASDTELKEIYKSIEKHINVSTVGPEINEIEERFKKELKHRDFIIKAAEDSIKEHEVKLELIMKILGEKQKEGGT